MRLTSRALWSFLGAIAYLAATITTAGILDVGLVFPRANETYEPSDQFPFVWAIQNNNLAKYLEFNINYRAFYRNSSPLNYIASSKSWPWSSDFGANGSDLYFFWSHYKVEVEGPVRLGWSGNWGECGEKIPQSSDGYQYSVNESSVFVIDFEMKRGGQKIDLVAATANRQNCPDQGFAISITGETKEVPEDYRGLPLTNATCAMVDTSPSPTPTANPCRVQIDEAAAESIDAKILDNRCSSPWDTPVNCPKEDHASRQLATAGTATLVAALCAFGFFFS